MPCFFLCFFFGGISNCCQPFLVIIFFSGLQYLTTISQLFPLLLLLYFWCVCVPFSTLLFFLLLSFVCSWNIRKLSQESFSFLSLHHQPAAWDGLAVPAAGCMCWCWEEVGVIKMCLDLTFYGWIWCLWWWWWWYGARIMNDTGCSLHFEWQ